MIELPNKLVFDRNNNSKLASSRNNGSKPVSGRNNSNGKVTKLGIGNSDGELPQCQKKD